MLSGVIKIFQFLNFLIKSTLVLKTIFQKEEFSLARFQIYDRARFHAHLQKLKPNRKPKPQTILQPIGL